MPLGYDEPDLSGKGQAPGIGRGDGRRAAAEGERPLLHHGHVRSGKSETVEIYPTEPILMGIATGRYGATPVEQRSRALGRLAPPITAVRETIPDLILICRPDCTGMTVPVHRRSASMCQCQEPGRRCSSRASDRSSKPEKSVATVAKSQ